MNNSLNATFSYKQEWLTGKGYSKADLIAILTSTKALFKVFNFWHFYIEYIIYLLIFKQIFEQKQDSNGNYHKIDNVCDADFHNINGQNCTTIADFGFCDPSLGADFFLATGVATNNGEELNLNCPQCGCATTPISLYDV